MKLTVSIVGLACLLGSVVLAQDEEGIRQGNFVFKPYGEAEAAYDDRVGNSDADTYLDTVAGVDLYNLPAAYDVFAGASYGYRSYTDYDAFNDDFYTLRGGLGTSGNPLKWGASADWTKSLNYNVGYDPSTGQQPDSILSDSPNRRFVASGEVSYDVPLESRTAVRPAYSAQYYHQEFSDSSDAEWQTHRASVQLRRQSGEQTVYYAEVGYALQSNEDEDGYIGSAFVGVEGRISDKTSWEGGVGIATADYEQSGSDQGFVSRFKANWQATDKFSAYVFGGNDFEPGYGGNGSRWVYRLGYGIGWQPSQRCGVGLSMLHDYQDEVGGGTSSDPKIGILRTFFDADAMYKLLGRVSVGVGYRYVHDELPADQQVVSAKVVVAY